MTEEQAYRKMISTVIGCYNTTRQAHISAVDHVAPMLAVRADAERYAISRYGKSLSPVRFTREDVEKAARTIDPFGWGQLDIALRPYKENRGARGISGEQFWYGITWGQRGFRTEDEVRRWFLSERTDGKEGDWPCCVFPVRESLKQAAAILAIFGDVDHG